MYESDSEEEGSKPKRLDKGKGKATEEDEKRWWRRYKKVIKSQDKGKGTEEDETSKWKWLDNGLNLEVQLFQKIKIKC